MDIRRIAIGDINPAAYNPRIRLQPGDPEFEKLAQGMETFGLVEPLVWNERTGNLVGGHQRLTVLKMQGVTEVEVSVVSLDEAHEKALNIALNKISGDWDMPKLKDLLEELDAGEIDMDLTGFDSEELESLFTQTFEPPEVEDDDFDFDGAVESIEEPRSKKGDVWILGRHRLMCGDATVDEDVCRLMNGRLADMVFTDPPYNVNYTGGTADALKIQNDSMDSVKFRQFLTDAFTTMFTYTAPGAPIYICHADTEGSNFRIAMTSAGWLLKQVLVWVKNSLVLGRQDYHWRHEPILYGWKPGEAHRWYGGRKHDTVVDAEFGLTINQTDGGVLLHFGNGEELVSVRVPSYEIVANSSQNSSVLRVKRPTRNDEHPTMKPLDLVARALDNSSQPSDLVMDLFGGSGSTLLACEQLGRTCMTMELDPKYCDVIVRRWEEFTGETAVLGD
ncbi:site-specific DNA-methyltransferase [Alicyclobacillus sp. ALC3]|uniref:site-specific DNA-methyltransferase n=1 Tax=Alicyclobacillus sp. ALC3 TaxID=2796143 RepID=UPI002378A0FB|nr:site-specific DNA-methyltransferase [Alicyclobacillus sp. ALC3]WDL96393.1 DNA modification methylase [Alicyclobacillus sp. ALC3]